MLLILRREVQLREGLNRVDLLGDGFILQESFLVFALEEMQEVVMGWGSCILADKAGQAGQLSAGWDALSSLLSQGRPPSLLLPENPQETAGVAEQRCLCQTMVPPCRPGSQCPVRHRLWTQDVRGPQGGVSRARSSLPPLTTHPPDTPLYAGDQRWRPTICGDDHHAASFGRAERLKAPSQQDQEPPGAGTGKPALRQPPAAAADA